MDHDDATAVLNADDINALMADLSGSAMITNKISSRKRKSPASASKKQSGSSSKSTRKQSKTKGTKGTKRKPTGVTKKSGAKRLVAEPESGIPSYWFQDSEYISVVSWGRIGDPRRTPGARGSVIPDGGAESDGASSPTTNKRSPKQFAAAAHQRNSDGSLMMAGDSVSAANKRRRVSGAIDGLMNLVPNSAMAQTNGLTNDDVAWLDYVEGSNAIMPGVASSSADDVEGVLGLLGTKLSPMMQAQIASSGRLSPLGGAVLGGSAISLFPGAMNAERLRQATYF
jgi:hypothetical protein